MTTEQAIQTIQSISSLSGATKCEFDALDMAINALYTQQWISVNDRLPKDGKNVLVLIPYRGVVLNYVSYRESDEWYVPDRLGRFSLSDVTHWMPLPEPPKEAAEWKIS